MFTSRAENVNIFRPGRDFFRPLHNTTIFHLLTLLMVNHIKYKWNLPFHIKTFLSIKHSHYIQIGLLEN